MNITSTTEKVNQTAVSPRLKRIREDILHAPYQLCIEKARLLTEFLRSKRKESLMSKILSTVHYQLYKKSLSNSAKGIRQKKTQTEINILLMEYYRKAYSLNKESILIDFAEAFSYILNNMELKIYDSELIVGNLSSSRIGAPIHPDLGGLIMLPEIDTLEKREDNPILVDEKDRELLKQEIFPFWFNKSVLSEVPVFMKDPEILNTLLDGGLFLLTQFAGISHLTPDYPSVLKYGLRGLLNKVESKIKNTQSNDVKKLNYYKALKVVLEAGILYGKRWSSYLSELANREKNTSRKRELLVLADVFKNIPENPPQNFYEALQSVFIAHVLVHQESFQHGVSFGRLDQYLYPYYKNDIEGGLLTEQKAVELLGCFLGKAAELIPLFFSRATEYFSGLSSASGITLGGIKEDGTDAVNELSFIILRTYDQMRLRQPNIHARVHSNTNPEFLQLSFDILKRGGGMPAIFNDNTIVKALKSSGMELQDAENYAIVGCAEWGSPYNSFPAAGAVFINISMALHLALHGGKYNKRCYVEPNWEINDLNNIEDIIMAFSYCLDKLLKQATEGNTAIEKTHSICRPTPFLSAIVDGCIESGVEVNSGGAKYNTTGCQGVGLADVADSLMAIEQLVFVEKKISLREYIRVVDKNFKDKEELRAYILNKVSKYGEEHPRVNYFSKLVSDIYCTTVLKFNNDRGGKYIPGFWTMTTHQGFGNRMGASFNGRLKGEPLSNGVSPANGRDKKGPTATLNSVAGVASEYIGNGCVLNIKIHPNHVKGKSGNEILTALTEGYFDQGGMQLQFNIIDPKVLIAAKKSPELYADLVVRISGYSAYFNDLTESMKDELIERTLQQCKS